MNKDFKHLIKTLKSARLSRDEKRAGWTALTQELNLPTTSWWANLSGLIFSRQAGYVLATLILTLALGAGASQAAEGAVPGDIFYPLKTKVKEPVERLLVPNTPAAQANFETKLVEKRLDEAEQLIKEDRLDDERRAELKVNIATQAARAAKEEGKDELKSVLEKHEETIKHLEREDDSDKELRKEKEKEDKDRDKSSVRKDSPERHKEGKERED